MPGTAIKIHINYRFYPLPFEKSTNPQSLFVAKKNVKKAKLKWRCARHGLAPKRVIRERTIVIQFPLCSFNSPDAKRCHAQRSIARCDGCSAIRSKMEQLVIVYNYSYFWVPLTNKTYCHSENLNCQLFKHFWGPSQWVAPRRSRRKCDIAIEERD